MLNVRTDTSFNCHMSKKLLTHVGCVCLCVCVCVCVLVTQSSLSLTQWTVALWTPVHGISQPRILETLAILFSRVFSQTRDQTQVS